MTKHLLSSGDLSLEDINNIFDTAGRFHGRGRFLKGRTVVNLFYEPSTRTRTSFELAAKRLGADVVNFDVSTSSVEKGEDLRDTVTTLESLGADVLIVRHPNRGVPQQVTGWVDCSVINAGDGTREHPTQALLDLYTIREHFGKLAGLRVGIVGDVHHSRVANSLYFALAKVGAESILIGPRKLVSSRPGPYISYDLESNLPELDVCYMLRLQTERRQYITTDYTRHELKEYGKKFGLTKERAAMLPDHAIIMHPGPMNRGVEIDSDVADSPRSVIRDQVSNGVAVRAAVLSWL